MCIRFVTLVFCLAAFVFASCGQNTPTSLKEVTGEKTTVFFSLVEKNVRVDYLARIPTSTQVILATLKPLPDATHSLELTVPKGYILHVVEPLTDKELPYELIRFEGLGILATPLSEVQGYGLNRLVASDKFLYIIALPENERTPYREDDNIDLSQVVNQVPATHLGPRNVDLEFMKIKLREISGDKTVVINGTEQKITERETNSGRDLTRKYLVQELSKLGFSAVQRPYSRHFAGEFSSGINVIAEKKGKDPSKFILVTGHFDDVGNGAADDNGSGTVSLIGIANALKDVNFKYNIRLAGFDEEESGLIGSAYYTRQLESEGELSNLIGVYNLDMTGYDKNNDGRLAITDCDEAPSVGLSNLFYDVIERHKLRLQGYSSCSSASDHASFWEKDKPALMLIQDRSEFNSCYHQSCDKLSLINYELLTNIATGVSRVLIDNFGI